MSTSPSPALRAAIAAHRFGLGEASIDAAVRGTVNEAAEFATVDPEPDPSELYTDVLR